MKKTGIASFLLILTVLFTMRTPLAAAAVEAPTELLAPVVLLTEATTGMALFELNADVRREPDTMAKMMTLLLAAEAVESGRLVEGEVMENLFAMYIGSDDEACDAVAVTVAGSVEAFVELMNARATELGCTDTHFVNATGAKDARHYTTARDLARIASEGALHALFLEVAGARSHGDMTNTNYMLSPSRSKYYYKYCVFGKVSATYENGYGAVEFAERDGLQLVTVVLGAAAVILESDNSTEMQNLTEARRLLEWGYANYSWRTVLGSTDLIARAAVALGDGVDYVNLRPESDIVLMLQNELAEGEIKREINVFSETLGEELIAPIDAGAVLGEVVLLRYGVEVGRTALIADTNVRLQRMKLFTRQLKAALSGSVAKVVIACAAVLFLVYAIFVIRYQILRARYVKKKRAQGAAALREREKNQE